MKILGIETSCDETSIALLEIQNEQFSVLSHVTLSQAQKHAEYGGVFPSLAKREHARNLVPILEQVFEDLSSPQMRGGTEERGGGELTTSSSDHPHRPSGTSPYQGEEKLKKILEREPELYDQLMEFLDKYPNKPDIDYIAVTQGPGLAPALWVGVNFARVLSLVWDIPVVPINHMEGHIVSVLYRHPELARPVRPPVGRDSGSMEPSSTTKSQGRHGSLIKSGMTQIEFPALALLVSGGHTQLVVVKGIGDYDIIGETRDDAIGEAFDKVARLLGLPYPGGPEVSRLAEQSRQSVIPAQAGILSDLDHEDSRLRGNDKEITLPRPMLNSSDYDFSFSGIKTAVRVLVEKLGKEKPDQTSFALPSAEIAREFEDAVTEVLVKKTKDALEEYGAQTLIIAGGVSANKHIQHKFRQLAKELGVQLLTPASDLTGDNALMIALAGYFKIQANKKIPAMEDLVADANLRLGA